MEIMLINNIILSGSSSLAELISDIVITEGSYFTHKQQTKISFNQHSPCSNSKNVLSITSGSKRNANCRCKEQFH